MLKNVKLKEWRGIMPEKSKCLICGNEYLAVESHIVQKHHISKKEYYDKYLKKEMEGCCKLCGNQTNFSTIPNGYSSFCSINCSKKYLSTNLETKNKMIEKMKQTSLETYGAEHHMQSIKGGKEKLKDTMNKLYGVDYYTQTEEYKIKCKATSNERYGADHINLTKLGKEKIKNGFIEKYGVENVFQLEEIKEKAKQTKLKKYGDENYSNYELKKETLLKKYGVENFGCTPAGMKKRLLDKRNTFIDNIFNGDRLQGLVTPLFNKEEYVDSNTFYSFKCNICNSIFNSKLKNGEIPRCYECNKNNTVYKP
jgi:hypothetical protein